MRLVAVFLFMVLSFDVAGTSELAPEVSDTRLTRKLQCIQNKQKLIAQWSAASQQHYKKARERIHVFHNTPPPLWVVKKAPTKAPIALADKTKHNIGAQKHTSKRVVMGAVDLVAMGRMGAVSRHRKFKTYAFTLVALACKLRGAEFSGLSLGVQKFACRG